VQVDFYQLAGTSPEPVIAAIAEKILSGGGRLIVIADGTWRDAVLSYDRSFFLFDSSTLEGARETWKSLAAREGVERRYWAQEAGKWIQKA
jgi:DNA polymerase-3 subunit chi